MAAKVVNIFEIAKRNGKNNARFLYFGFRHASMSVKKLFTYDKHNSVTI